MTGAVAEPSADTSDLRVERRERLRRLHAFSGLFPVGVFLVEHIVVNAKALGGQAAFERATSFVDGVPLRGAVEWLFVLVPLAFHAVFGAVLLADTSQRRSPSPYAPSWLALSRGAAVVALLFIAYHLYAVRYARWASGVGSSSIHTLMTAHLSSAYGSAAGVAVPWTALVYLVGAAATIVHFSASAWGFMVRFGYVVTPSALRRAAYACGALGAVLFALTSLTILSFASGAPLWPPAHALTPCPNAAPSGPAH